MDSPEGPSPPPPSPPPSSSSPQLWRVKLYQLNGTGEWDDLGTGHISLSPAIASSSCAAPTLTLQKTSSDSNSDSPTTTQPDAVEIEVKHDVVYQRQGDNIITWFEQGTNGAEGGDLALSFQDNDGCREVWKGIFEAQKMAAKKAEKEGSMERKRRKMNPESEGDMSEVRSHEERESTSNEYDIIARTPLARTTETCKPLSELCNSFLVTAKKSNVSS